MWWKHATFLGLLAVTWGSVVKRSTDNPCYQCPSFDATGRGFLRTPDDDCTSYLECWKVLGTGRIQPPLRRPCPIGTMLVNEDAARGAPCGPCDPVVCPNCIRDFTTIDIILDCHYTQMVPASDFGMDDGSGGILKVGSCGLGGYFNDSFAICTCTEVGPGCTYRIDIPLVSTIDDVSCHRAWVGQTGMPAMVRIDRNIAPPGAAGSGIFWGYDPDVGGGPHLTTYSLDGVFAGNWVFQLSFNVWFRRENNDPGTMGIITLGDCALGASAYIWIVNGRVVAGLETFVNNTLLKHELSSPPNQITAEEWYFASVTYDSALESDNIRLYVFDAADYAACAANNPADCTPVDTADAKGSVSPRGCGFHVGSTAAETTEEYFVGHIGQVKVNQGYGIF